jgi:hypothetical protein
MKIAKYTVRIPKPSSFNEYNEFVFYTMYEVSKFLDIKESIVYKIMNKEYKYSHKKSMRLKGISIIKDELPFEVKEELKKKYAEKIVDDKIKKKLEETNKIAEEYQKQLVEKYDRNK